MKNFEYAGAETVERATMLCAEKGTKAIAGGTNLIDLMKLQVETPARLVDINSLDDRRIEDTATGLRIAALASNTAVAVDQRIRVDYPVLVKAILAGATQQLRNKASVGGNLGQRTRCPYFTNIDQPCNKRQPGSGCGALKGVARIHAILGTSLHCIATYPGDMAVAMAALDAQVEISGPDNERRTVPVREFHRCPGDTPELDNILGSGELVVAVHLPAPVSGKQLYRKVRERSSYAFALCSVAAIVDVKRGKIARADLAFGSIAPKPWVDERLAQMLVGEKPGMALFEKAADVLVDVARGVGDNDYKIPLVRRTLIATLCEATEVWA
ncbi:FAD binding domain-containing protein [Sphingorhabdus sp.]|uniref:FAD binding domain-containing protein n=1 Tax=Sphingorhabdus sp. TaxID=1902408 RepID=UPI0039838C17